LERTINQAVELLKAAKHAVAFTGAGISVESGIPTFRGDDGFWSRYDPMTLDINYFKNHPSVSWKIIKEIFYDFFDNSHPNEAHFALADMERKTILKRIITQNIDNLHQEAGSSNVVEFHGNSHVLVCLNCLNKHQLADIELDNLPGRCSSCGGLLKPDFVFFGEEIPRQALLDSMEEARRCDVMLVVGTSGEVMPASQVPLLAKQSGADIIEINIQETLYTQEISDIFLKGSAPVILKEIAKKLAK